MCPREERGDSAGGVGIDPVLWHTYHSPRDDGWWATWWAAWWAGWDSRGLPWGWRWERAEGGLLWWAAGW